VERRDLKRYIYTRRIIDRKLYTLHGSEEKIANCARFITTSLMVNSVLGEANSHFWTDPRILGALDIFLNRNNTKMKIVMGPDIDVEGIEFWKRIAVGIQQNKIELYISKNRKNYHIKEFYLEDGKKEVVAEPPHKELQRERKNILVCDNDAHCSEIAENYFEKSKDDATKIDLDGLIKYQNFIAYDRCANRHIPASEMQIQILRALHLKCPFSLTLGAA
jgi:hypothetical protein